MIIAIDLDSVICKPINKLLLDKAKKIFNSSDGFSRYPKEKLTEYDIKQLMTYGSRSLILNDMESDKEAVEYLRRIKGNNYIILLTSYGTNGNWDERPTIFKWLVKEGIEYDMVLFDSDKVGISQLFNADVVITADSSVYSELIEGKYNIVPFFKSNNKESNNYIEWSKVPVDWR